MPFGDFTSESPSRTSLADSDSFGESRIVAIDRELYEGKMNLHQPIAEINWVAVVCLIGIFAVGYWLGWMNRGGK